MYSTESTGRQGPCRGCRSSFLSHCGSRLLRLSSSLSGSNFLSLTQSSRRFQEESLRLHYTPCGGGASAQLQRLLPGRQVFEKQLLKIDLLFLLAFCVSNSSRASLGRLATIFHPAFPFGRFFHFIRQRHFHRRSCEHAGWLLLTANCCSSSHRSV